MSPSAIPLPADGVELGRLGVTLIGPLGVEVVLDLLEGRLDLPAFAVERDQFGGRVVIRAQWCRAEVGDLVVLAKAMTR
ncbi:hypothetical protein AB0442_23105 [Kitasatospora sp. NPDC085895]|uniref:hypothetical protein n=1 Tax=Kitasatospora sp. NPDC085895 TaxID=3155057 RepID=UPI00344B1FAA